MVSKSYSYILFLVVHKLELAKHFFSICSFSAAAVRRRVVETGTRLPQTLLSVIGEWVYVFWSVLVFVCVCVSMFVL